MVGMMTYSVMETNVGAVAVDEIISTIFALEVLLKMIAEGFAPWRYLLRVEMELLDFLICFVGYLSSQKWPSN